MLVEDFLAIPTVKQQQVIGSIRKDRLISKRPPKATKPRTPKGKKSKIEAFEKAFSAMSEHEQEAFITNVLKKKDD
jgi:hypothetical protein